MDKMEVVVEVEVEDEVAVGTRRGCDECGRDGRGVDEEMQVRLWDIKTVGE